MSPTSGTILTGASFYLNVNPQNFLFCNPYYGKDLQPNVGHWHVFSFPVNGMPPMSFPSPVAALMFMQPHMQTMAYTDGQQVYLNGLAPGWYVFRAVLVQNNHMPFMVMNSDGCVSLQPGTFGMTMLYVSALS